MIEFDIFDFKDQNLLSIFLSSKNIRLIESTMVLLNLIVSDREGANYIIQNLPNIQKLIEILFTEDKDSYLRQQILAIIQKLSLKREVQNILIENSVIEWIIDKISKPETLSNFTLEYATALLMNLALRTSGKDRCENPSIRIIEKLKNLLTFPFTQIRTYVNGTLYSLMSRKSLKEEAFVIVT